MENFLGQIRAKLKLSGVAQIYFAAVRLAATALVVAGDLVSATQHASSAVLTAARTRTADLARM
jgi:hypothetical protein